jgi:hypothetical protein
VAGPPTLRLGCTDLRAVEEALNSVIYGSGKLIPHISFQTSQFQLLTFSTPYRSTACWPSA